MKKHIGAGLALLSLVLGGQMALAADKNGFQPPTPTLEPLARFVVNLEAPVWELGQTSDLGRRRIISNYQWQFRRCAFEGQNT